MEIKVDRRLRETDILPQGSVLAPCCLTFTQTVNQSVAKRNFFIYADDLTLTAQGLTFKIVENSQKF